MRFQQQAAAFGSAAEPDLARLSTAYYFKHIIPTTALSRHVKMIPPKQGGVWSLTIW
jgi:hypothetical protein